MRCEKCGEKTVVVETIQDHKNGTIRRVRRCEKCSTRYTTVERVVEAKNFKRRNRILNV